jgi:D-amino-acid dehydrogenase
VTGGYTLGARGAVSSEAALRPLYGALDRWFGHATDRRSPQIWQGARPMLPDGPPIVGPAPMPGVWLNVGHGAHGWTLACGSARLLAEQMSGVSPSVDPVPFALSRWQA